MMASAEDSKDMKQPEADVLSQSSLPSEGSVMVKKKGRFSLETFPLCDPRHFLHRYSLLILMCFLSFGNYFVYDNPASLPKIIKNVMNIDTTHYQLLYSLYSWPNVILSVFGGFLIDRVLGIRWGTVIFSTFVCLGQFVFALGAFVDLFWLMVVGRFIFGLGGENLAVAQNNYAVLWFKGKELNMVFGLLLSISRVGSTVNMNINRPLYNSLGFVNPNYVRLGTVLLLGFVLCLLSLGCGVILGLFDKRAERITRRKEEGSGERISLWDIKDFPLRLWLVFIICVFYYVTVFPFIGLATVFLEDKYGYRSSEANIVNSLVYWLSAVASPFLGIMVDKLGFNLFFLNLGTLATLAAHAMLGFLGSAPYLPYIAMVLMGLAYSLLACALWPLVAFIVPEHQLGTAYGIMQSIQNLGLAVVTIITGVIVDNNGYLLLEVFFLICLCVTLIAGILLYILDSAAGGRLNMSAWTRNHLEKKEKEEKERLLAEKKLPPELLESGSRSDYTSPVTPRSAFHIRNRLLSKMGAKLPEHVYVFNPLTKSFAAHTSVLK